MGIILDLTPSGRPGGKRLTHNKCSVNADRHCDEFVHLLLAVPLPQDSKLHEGREPSILFLVVSLAPSPVPET